MVAETWDGVLEEVSSYWFSRKKPVVINRSSRKRQHQAAQGANKAMSYVVMHDMLYAVTAACRTCFKMLHMMHKGWKWRLFVDSVVLLGHTEKQRYVLCEEWAAYLKILCAIHEKYGRYSRAVEGGCTSIDAHRCKQEEQGSKMV